MTIMHDGHDVQGQIPVLLDMMLVNHTNIRMSRSYGRVTFCTFLSQKARLRIVYVVCTPFV